MQFGIGELGKGFDGQWEGSLGHMVLHGLAGCAFAEASGGDCAAGAVGGVSQSLYAGYLGRHGLVGQEYTQTAALIGGVAGYFASGGNGANVGLASTTARSGLQNNYLSHGEKLEELILAQLLEDCDSGLVECSADEMAALQAETSRLQQLDQMRDEYLLAVCAAGMRNECAMARADMRDAYATYSIFSQFSSKEDYAASVGGLVFAEGVIEEMESYKPIYDEAERLLLNEVSIPFDGRAFGLGLAAGATLHASLAAVPSLISCLASTVCATELAAGIGDEVAMTGGSLTASIQGGRIVFKAGKKIVTQLDDVVALLPP